MTGGLDSFGLAELTARPEDAMRLAGLAMAEGQRVAGYRGDYYRYRLGDAAAVVRLRRDPDSGQEELLGIDAHTAGGCPWTCRVVKNVTPEGADEMSLRLLVEAGEAGDRAVVNVLCADVLPDPAAGDELRLQMAGFPLRVSYDQGESLGVVEPGEDTTLLQGVVKDAKVGETYLGMEPLTRFVSVTAATRMGDVELCHPVELVKEAQRDLVKPGAVVSALCVLAGDAAAGLYAGGTVFDEAHDLALLARFFRQGDVERLRPVLRSDCAVTFLENRQEGLVNAMALLEMVRRDLGPLDRQGLGAVAAGPQGTAGRGCLLLGGAAGWAFLGVLELDSLGRIRAQPQPAPAGAGYPQQLPGHGAVLQAAGGIVGQVEHHVAPALLHDAQKALRIGNGHHLKHRLTLLSISAQPAPCDAGGTGWYTGGRCTGLRFSSTSGRIIASNFQRCV